MFENLFQECNQSVENGQITFKQKKFTKLISLFQTCETYYSIMVLNGNSGGESDHQKYFSDYSNNNSKNMKIEFYMCGLCYHYLYDPVTLVCGCTFCKMCLDEYNHSQFQIAVLKQYTDPSKHLYKCKNCNYSHNQNSSQYLNTNVFISKIIDKAFTVHTDSRALRNDIRKCIYLKIIDYNKAMSLLNQAFFLGNIFFLVNINQKS